VAATPSAVAIWQKMGVQRSGMGLSINGQGGVNEGLKTYCEA
jgi:hypothetical protein